MKVAARRRYTMSTRAAAAAATHERILESTTLEFLTRPYEQVSLEDVATRAGVTVHFPVQAPGALLHVGPFVHRLVREDDVWVLQREAAPGVAALTWGRLRFASQVSMRRSPHSATSFSTRAT